MQVVHQPRTTRNQKVLLLKPGGTSTQAGPQPEGAST